jgi:peroxiredoxin Q/BCP
MRIVRTLGCALLAFGLVGLAAADDKKAGVNVGDAAPKFEGTDEQGKVWKSEDHVGKNVVVVYFFPAAMTGG